MTDDPHGMLEIRDSRLELVADFLAWVSYVLAFFPIVYGAILLVVGDDGWGFTPTSSDRVSDVYETALAFPGAPESWAVIAVLIGIGIVVGQWRANRRLLSVSLTFLSLWFSFFAVAFVSSWVKNDWYAPSLLPSVVYTMAGLISIGRARMVWGWRDF